MEGRLITDGNNNYSLLDYNNELVATTMESGLTSGKLSIKNCETIVNGYDLDDLASEYANAEGDYDAYYGNSGFINGFKKALEILGEKRFSEDDLRLAMHFGKFGETNNQTTTIGFIKSLQQTEWDVEIVTEKQCDCICHRIPGTMHMEACCNPGHLTLDVDGCLILKRK